MKKTIIISLVLFSLGITYYLFTKPISPMDALAEELVIHAQESHWESGFLPDFIYCLKVKANKKQFIEFTNKLVLVNKTKLNTIPQTCNTKMQNANWWDPPNINNAELIYQLPETTQEMGELAIFKDGMLYFIAWNS